MQSKLQATKIMGEFQLFRRRRQEMEQIFTLADNAEFPNEVKIVNWHGSKCYIYEQKQWTWEICCILMKHLGVKIVPGNHNGMTDYVKFSSAHE